jgi:hypothetical protein
MATPRGIRIAALEGLRRAIEARVPELAGRVAWFVNRAASRPMLTIVPIRATYQPQQATEVKLDTLGAVVDPAPDLAVMNVGTYELLVQLRLEHDTPELRADLAEEVSATFLEDGERPGILLTRISEVARFGTFTAAWELEEDEWNDDLAFNDEHESLLTLTGTIPALVMRREAWRIRDLRLGVGLQIGLDWGDPRLAVVRVNDDGTITPVE